ncbi:hypothetical protein AKJ16_DCAP16644 [Drosera capensis]
MSRRPCWSGMSRRHVAYSSALRKRAIGDWIWAAWLDQDGFDGGLRRTGLEAARYDGGCPDLVRACADRFQASWWLGKVGAAPTGTLVGYRTTVGCSGVVGFGASSTSAQIISCLSPQPK